MQLKKNISILIADDHPSLRYGLRSILIDLPFVELVDEAANGEEALTLLKNKVYDMILMDIRMPICNGLSATEIIKKEYPEVKIIAFSMHIEERYVKEMIDKGASGYLLKSADREVIIEAIVSVMQGKMFFSKEVSESIYHNYFDHEKENFKKNSRHEEHLREIIFLLCQEMTSKEIADILCFSPRTVEQYRRELNKHIGTENMAGVIKYGIENGISDDIILRNKFEKLLGHKKHHK